MASIVTDQFRLFNADNFVNSVENSSNSYYVFTALPNPTGTTITGSSVGFGRSSTWDQTTPNPIDCNDYMNAYHDPMMFGQSINASNIRRIVRRVDWASGSRYEMYRHDYSILNPSPVTQSYRLYDANYYVMNSNYNVYICINNGSSGINTTGNISLDQPTFTDLEPSAAGTSGDGYVWKYLFTVSPSDIIKFDSLQYITVPDNWSSSTDAQITAIRTNGNSTLNNNQIKTVYIANGGSGYTNVTGQSVNILGDGSGATALVDVVGGSVTKVTITSGGSGYTYGIVDLGAIAPNPLNPANAAELIPIIPPSLGHGYDIYKELGTDKVLVYSRFDDSTKDYPIDTKYAQVGIIKNPTSFGSTAVFTNNSFSSLYAIKVQNGYVGTLNVGDIISQSISGVGTAYGYVASFDTQTNVIKYFKDRSLYFNPLTANQSDYSGVSVSGEVLNFQSTSTPVVTTGGFSGSIDLTFSGITTNPTGNNIINLSITFNSGLANPDINKSSGDIIYIDNRPTISRNSRQKEDVKIILEF
jgi:hypothetical protein